MKISRSFIFLGCTALLLIVISIVALNVWLKKAFPPLPPLRTHETIENLVIAVAPLETQKLFSQEGTQTQEKIALHMEKDLGLKALRLSKPVSMGFPDHPDLDLGFKNAEKILADSGADLLIWGHQDTSGDGKDWNIYISASVKARCLAREAGYSIHETSNLDRVGGADILEVLDWVTASWRGLLGRTEGMYIAKDLKPMVDKIDAVLGIVAEKHLGSQADLEVKSNLALFLSEYGEQTKDVQALQNSIRLARSVIADSPKDPELRSPVGDMETESILARCLFTLGCQQMDNSSLKGSAEAYEIALRMVNKKYDSANWVVLQVGLGSALSELGKRQADKAKIERAAVAFEGALKETSQQAQPHLWLCVQTGLGACYEYMGARETSTVNLKKAIPHFESALAKDAEVMAPEDAATAETNLGGVYFTVGDREHSAEDMRQSIQHSTKAEDLFQKMGNNYGLGFATGNLGMAQLRLGYYSQDDAVIRQSLQTLKKSQALIPKAQDVDFWSQNQLYLGLGDELLGSKSFDRQILQEASDIFKEMRKTFDRHKRRPMWNELGNFQAEVEVLLGNLDCGSQREDGVIKILEEIRSGPGSQKDDLRAEQVEETLGKAYNHKGNKAKDPATVQKGVALLEDALELADRGNMETVRCSCRSELLLAYSNLLPLAPDAALAAKAKSALETFEGECPTAPVPPDRASHAMSVAKLERSLAKFESNKTWLDKARPQAESALKIFQEHQYVFFSAAAQLELGNEDYLLGDMTGDKKAYQRAFEEFTEAEKIFNSFGFCWEKDLKDKIGKSKALAN